MIIKIQKIGLLLLEIKNNIFKKKKLSKRKLKYKWRLKNHLLNNKFNKLKPKNH